MRIVQTDSLNCSQGSLQKIIAKLFGQFEAHDWPVGDYRKIQYLLSGFPRADISLKYLYAKDIYLECIKDLNVLSLEVIAKFDEMLGLTGKRRHFNHSFEIFLLGIILIHSKRETLKSVCGDSDEAWKRNFMTWLFTAASHDMGYPLEQSSKIIETIADMYAGINVVRISDKFKTIYTKKFLVTEDYLFKYYHPQTDDTNIVYDLEKIMKAAFRDSLEIDDRDAIEREYLRNKALDVHGFVSALLLARHTIGSSLEAEDEDFNLEALKLAIGAVMIHSLPLDRKENEKHDLLIYRIDPAKNPFAYLLALLDNLQDWDRNYDDVSDSFAYYTLDDFSYENTKELMFSFVAHCQTDKSVENALKFIESKKKIRDIAKNYFKCELTVKYKFERPQGVGLEFEDRIKSAVEDPALVGILI